MKIKKIINFIKKILRINIQEPIIVKQVKTLQKKIIKDNNKKTYKNK